MRYLLNATYAALLVALSPWLLYAAVRNGKYRQGWGPKLLGLVPKLTATQNRRFWFHAVSVGEVNLLAPILRRLLMAEPSVEIVITATTKTGFELAQKRFAQHTVCYCPLDFSWAVRNAIRRLKPDLLVLVELELWPNLLLEAHRNAIPVAIVNGRLSDRSTQGYLRLGRWLPNPMKKVLNCVSAVGAQSQSCADRFVQLGFSSDLVQQTGSIKFDGAETNRHNPLSEELRRIANIKSGQPVFVAGSTQAPEEEYALAAFQRLTSGFPELRLILVPRHPERSDQVAQMLDQSGISWRRRTQIDANHPVVDEKIVLVDTVGELGGWWGCANIGFVGGSMGKRGGQNMLEPSGFGVATCFGPKTRNFRDIVEQLLAADSAVVVHDAESILSFVRHCLTDHGYAQDLGKRAQQVVLSQRGATDATVRMLRQLADTKPTVLQSRFLLPETPAKLRRSA